jgi:hypothetical protein
MGFVLTPEEREALVSKNRLNEARIFPYLGGEEVNTSPTQDFDRYVINFGSMSLEEAETWPDLLAIVREKVKPERDRVNRDAHRKNWWHYADKRPGLYSAIAGLRRCLAWSQVSKHLVFAWQPTDRVFSHALCVAAIEDNARFAVLQSRIHECWARLLSSTMEDRLRYASSDCFENFPFPRPVQLTPDSPLERIGGELYDFRAKLMVERNHGLTVTYNQLKDPQVHDPKIVELRRLHEEMDRAVLAAYGWSDIAVPPYSDPISRAFEDEIIDRLLELNVERAAEEAEPTLFPLTADPRRTRQGTSQPHSATFPARGYERRGAP